MKYQKFTPLDCKDKEIRKFEFVARTQFLCKFLFHFDLGFSKNRKNAHKPIDFLKSVDFFIYSDG